MLVVKQKGLLPPPDLPNARFQTKIECASVKLKENMLGDFQRRLIAKVFKKEMSKILDLALTKGSFRQVS